MTNPTLYQFVASRLPSDLGADLHDYAKIITAEIPSEAMEEYLAQAVRSILAEVIGERRRRAMDAAVVGDALVGREEAEESSARAQSIPCSQPSASSRPTNMNRRRVNRHRNWWTDLLAQRGLSASGGQVTIGAMTAADLRANIDHRESLARENVARADQFRRLLKLVEDQNVTTVAEVRDVPESLAA